MLRGIIAGDEIRACSAAFLGWGASQMLNQGNAVSSPAVNLADAFARATRLIRVEQHASRCQEKSELDQLPFTAPWLQLYKRSADAEHP